MDNNDKISKRTKYKTFDKIINSDEFYKKTKYQELLNYLVDVSIYGDVLKESTLAIDFFKKDATFDPSQDSSVRASVSNLRKKIEHYYLTEGQNDKIQLTIPKGHYYVKFINKQQKSNITLNRNFIKPSYVLLIPIALIFLFYFFKSDKENIQQELPLLDQNNFLWQDWFKKNQKVLIILGNYYFYEMPFENDKFLFIRNQYINSDDDLTNFLEKNPSYKKQFQFSGNTYLDEHIPYCLSYILKSFWANNKQYELKLSSEVQIEDIRNYNIIYIGPYKCLNILKNITKNLHFNYVQQSVTLNFFKGDSNNVLTFPFKNPGKQIRFDHAMVVKVAGAYNNEYIFFTSYYDFGNLATVKHFTNPDSLYYLTKQIRSDYFEALFEVQGVHDVRMDLNFKLLHYNPLKSDFKIGID